ncbi:MAG: TonB family protein [bacterium]
MAKSVRQLYLKIEQAGKVFYHRLSDGDRFTIGQHPKNDVTVYGEHFPKQHTLFLRKGKHYLLRFKKYMSGEVVAKKSKLTLHDLIDHNLLTMKGDDFYYPLSYDKSGFVVIDDVKISFKFVSNGQRETAIPEFRNFRGYSWLYATFRDLGRDLPFKAILIAMILVHGFLLNYMNKIPITLNSQVREKAVPERFAKIIMRNTAATAKKRVVAPGAAESEESASEADKPGQPEKGREAAKPESQGVLGLLTGTGSSNQTSNLADLLLDKGLVRELDEVMSTSQLQKGSGSKNNDEAFDELISRSELGGDIDEILDGVDDVESVQLGEKGRIEVDQVGSIQGSEAALGKRSEESVRTVMLAYTGRMTYIYNKYLKQNPDMSGKLVVEVVIAANGKVESTKIITSTMNNSDFDREILNLIRRWKYPAIDNGTVTVTYPLFFNKIG